MIIAPRNAHCEEANCKLGVDSIIKHSNSLVLKQIIEHCVTDLFQHTNSFPESLCAMLG